MEMHLIRLVFKDVKIVLLLVISLITLFYFLINGIYSVCFVNLMQLNLKINQFI